MISNGFNKMASHRRTLNTCLHNLFKTLQVISFLLFCFHFCCANSSCSDGAGCDDRYHHHNHIQYQKQKTSKNYHQHHSDRQRNKRNEEMAYHKKDAESSFNSIDRFYDLSHAYFDGMPVEEGGIPLELSLMKQDGGEGAR